MESDTLAGLLLKGFIVIILLVAFIWILRWVFKIDKLADNSEAQTKLLEEIKDKLK